MDENRERKQDELGPVNVINIIRSGSGFSLRLSPAHQRSDTLPVPSWLPPPGLFYAHKCIYERVSN